MSEASELIPFPPVYLDEQDPSVGVGWSIADLGSADWALSRLADLEAEISENEAVAERAIARIMDRTRELNDRASKGVAFFRSCLMTFARAHRAELLKGGTKKSRALLHGTIAWRAKGGGLVVEDSAALLAWAQSQPVELGLVRIKEEPALAEIKKHAEAGQLVPPGMRQSEKTEEIEVHAALGGLPHGK